MSSEWFSRPDDERFLSLRALHPAVLARAERATNRTVETREVRVEASRDDPERLTKARILEAVTGAINARGGHVFYQLMHAGRMNGSFWALARNS